VKIEIKSSIILILTKKM